MRKLHLHLHPSSKKNHANLNETVSIVTVIENPFFVNYGFSKAFSTVTKLKQKKLVIVEVGGFKNGHVKLMFVCARVFVFWTKIKKETGLTTVKKGN